MKLKNLPVKPLKSAAKPKTIWVATYIDVQNNDCVEATPYFKKPTADDLECVDSWVLVSLVEITL